MPTSVAVWLERVHLLRRGLALRYPWNFARGWDRSKAFHAQRRPLIGRWLLLWRPDYGDFVVNDGILLQA